MTEVIVWQLKQSCAAAFSAGFSLTKVLVCVFSSGRPFRWHSHRSQRSQTDWVCQFQCWQELPSLLAIAPLRCILAVFLSVGVYVHGCKVCEHTANWPNRLAQPHNQNFSVVPRKISAKSAHALSCSDFWIYRSRSCLKTKSDCLKKKRARRKTCS